MQRGCLFCYWVLTFHCQFNLLWQNFSLQFQNGFCIAYNFSSWYKYFNIAFHLRKCFIKLFDQFIYCTPKRSMVYVSVFCKKSVIVEPSSPFFFSLNLSMANNTSDFKSETANNPLLSSSGLSPTEIIESLSREKLISFSELSWIRLIRDPIIYKLNN